MLRPLIDLLRANPLLLLCLVVAIGYPLGRIKVQGSSLGVAAVLFAGLAVGALDPELKLPEIVYQIGLIAFVYTIGLANGRAFFAALRREGLRNVALVVGVLALATVLTVAARAALNLRPTLAAGMFAGSLTNTPALAGLLEYLGGTANGPDRERLLSDPVVAYSLTYPVGVIGMLLAIAVAQRLWRIDYAAEARRVRAAGATARELANRTVRVTREGMTGVTLDSLRRAHGWDVVFGRVRRGDDLAVVGGATRLAVGDLITVVGAREELARVAAALGEASDEHLDLDRHELDYRRIFVSDSRVAGHRLRDLHLRERFGAVITRVRRGDVEFVPHGDTVLALGDRVRVVAPRDSLGAVGTFLGDSYRALSEIDVLTFSLGLALGLLLGAIPLPLPGGVTLRLGSAGGPLVAALVLGALDRTGPFVWTLPYSANLTLRQVGLLLFLAGVGTRAGYAFVSTLTSGGGAAIVAAGAGITIAAAVVTLWVGHRLLHIPMGLLIGMLAGLQTQPAVLGYALEQTDDELPNLGYATVFPVAMIAKILLAQVLLALWR